MHMNLHTILEPVLINKILLEDNLTYSFVSVFA